MKLSDDDREMEIYLAFLEGVCRDLGVDLTYTDPPNAVVQIGLPGKPLTEFQTLAEIRALCRGLSIGSVGGTKAMLRLAKEQSEEAYLDSLS